MFRSVNEYSSGRNFTRLSDKAVDSPIHFTSLKSPAAGANSSEGVRVEKTEHKKKPPFSDPLRTEDIGSSVAKLLQGHSYSHPRNMPQGRAIFTAGMMDDDRDGDTGDNGAGKKKKKKKKKGRYWGVQ